MVAGGTTKRNSWKRSCAALVKRLAIPSVTPEVDWPSEEFSRGCVSYCGPGVWTGYGRALREPIGRIHWAASELASVFPGQIEGAVRSGHQAARAVLMRLTPD